MSPNLRVRRKYCAPCYPKGHSHGLRRPTQAADGSVPLHAAGPRIGYVVPAFPSRRWTSACPSCCRGRPVRETEGGTTRCATLRGTATASAAWVREADNLTSTPLPRRGTAVLCATAPQGTSPRHPLLPPTSGHRPAIVIISVPQPFPSQLIHDCIIS